MRELLGESEFELVLPDGATLVDCWEALRARNRKVDALGHVAALLDERVADGDEIALLPPVGGG
jgi:molybdopterin converting factor small subunit